jgi:RNA polymerase sigma factor (sigma-70 family)
MGVARSQRRRTRREEVDPAALALIARHGAQILATARRYSASLDDAEDAYQRALEILLTKAPTTSEDELVPWLKTVVKHEAFAIRRQRERHTPTTEDGELGERPTGEAATHDQAERYERLRLGAEAMRRLKPQEIRCLLLKAEGYSYKEICQITGWTYTKVNRCLTEGRRAFVERLARIEAGSECERLLPLVSALVDGEASSEDLRALLPHLRACLACRARLRELRAAPKRVAALLPPVAVAHGDPAGPLRSFFESMLGAAQHKAAAFGERAHTAAELATGQKVAAVAASAAALAGGGAAVDQFANHRRPPPPTRPAEQVETKPVTEEVPVEPAPQSAPPVAEQSPAQPAPAPAPDPPPAPPQLPPDPANEFDPAAAATPAPASSSPPPSQPGGESFTAGAGVGGGSRAGGGGGGAEFAP